LRKVKLPMEIEEFIRAYLILDRSIVFKKRYEEFGMRVKGGRSQSPANDHLIIFKDRILNRVNNLKELIYDELEK